MIAMCIQGDGTAPQKRRSLLLIDVDPLLRWSIVTHLRKAFDIQLAETLDEGRRLLMQQGFDAVILSNGYRAQVIRELEALAKLQNEQVTIVRLITGAESKSQELGIRSLKKPFELASLSNALSAWNT